MYVHMYVYCAIMLRVFSVYVCMYSMYTYECCAMLQVVQLCKSYYNTLWHILYISYYLFCMLPKCAIMHVPCILGMY